MTLATEVAPPSTARELFTALAAKPTGRWQHAVLGRKVEDTLSLQEVVWPGRRRERLQQVHLDNGGGEGRWEKPPESGSSLKQRKILQQKVRQLRRTARQLGRLRSSG